MEFDSESPEGDTLMVASIASVNAGLSAPTMESLDDLKHHHTREVMNIQERMCVCHGPVSTVAHSKASSQSC